MKHPPRLGVNIDHVATLRNARGELHPCPVRAAQAALAGGAEGITVHLREDRRHIRDRDVERLLAEVPLPLNLEMAATEEMLTIALRLKPPHICIVPEKREEITTEGGLDVARHEHELRPYVSTLQDAGLQVSLFVDPFSHQIEAAARTGARCIELHTGAYAKSHADRTSNPEPYKQQLSFLYFSAITAAEAGLIVHAGHGLNYDNVRPIAALPPVEELNIGHFLIGEAVFSGLEHAVRTMRARIAEGCT